MEFLKSTAWGLFGIVMFVVLIALFIGLVSLGGDVVIPFLLPYLSGATGWLTTICILGLPLGFFRKTRGFIGIVYVIASYIFGLTLLALGFLFTYYYWGVIGVIIGAVFLGFGVVITGFLASIFNSDWSAVGGLVYLIVLSYGVRMLGTYWITKSEETSYVVLEDNADKEDTHEPK